MKKLDLYYFVYFLLLRLAVFSCPSFFLLKIKISYFFVILIDKPYYIATIIVTLEIDIPNRLKICGSNNKYEEIKIRFLITPIKIIISTLHDEI